MQIPVFYSPKQIHDADSHSKSPLKPKMLAEKIAADPAFKFHDGFAAATLERLAQTHDAGHVAALINGTSEDGFGNCSKQDNVAIRYTVGNFLQAAEWAIVGRQKGDDRVDVIHPGVVWSLTSGFHHAHEKVSGAYCTYEALTLSAFELHKFRGIKTLIVDEDAHFGDGCVAMIKRHDMGAYCSYLQSAHTHSRNVCLSRFKKQLDQGIDVVKPGIIMYQAGADNWFNDPLGGQLSMNEMVQRDLIVFETAKQRGIPVVCNLAGGYAEDYNDTLLIHMSTGEAMKEVYL